MKLDHILLSALLLLGIAFNSDLQAQDPIFSQFYAAPLQLNPAFAGNNYAPRIAFNYRNQYPAWTSEGSAYETYSASYDQYFEDINSGIGLLVLTDDAGNGILKTNRLSAIYSYRLQLSRDFFAKLGVEGSFVQTQLDWDKLLFPDQIDPEAGPISPGGTPFPTTEVRPDDLTTSYFDISTGMLLYNDIFYGGVTLKHLNTPRESFLDINDNLNNGLPLRVSLHTGAQFNLQPNNKRDATAFISPNLMYVRQGDFQQMNVGAYAGAAFVYGGVWYRTTFTNADAAIFLVGVRKDLFKIGYSYDLTISGLAGETGGSHEISLAINFQRPNRVDLNDCFEMFR
jgi:type IX secretion system PorP/SprF family membrane protein